jgi:hypothetical protein
MPYVRGGVRQRRIPPDEDHLHRRPTDVGGGGLKEIGIALKQGKQRIVGRGRAFLQLNVQEEWGRRSKDVATLLHDRPEWTQVHDFQVASRSCG